MSSWVGPSPPHTITRVGPAERLAHGADDPVVVVADLRLEDVLDAAQRQLLADPGRVGVDDLPEQQLGADRHDLGPVAGHLAGARPRGEPGAGPDVLRAGDDREDHRDPQQA